MPEEQQEILHLCERLRLLRIPKLCGTTITGILQHKFIGSLVIYADLLLASTLEYKW